MNIGELLDFTLSMPAVEESFPFGENVLVLKVKGKMFLAISLNSIPLQFNAKCDPERAISLREEYEDRLLQSSSSGSALWLCADHTMRRSTMSSRKRGGGSLPAELQQLLCAMALRRSTTMRRSTTSSRRRRGFPPAELQQWLCFLLCTYR